MDHFGGGLVVIWTPPERRIVTRQRQPYQQQQAAPGGALLMVGPQGPSDPFWNNVVLLSHMDNGSYLDVKGHAVTITGSPSNVAGQTGFSNCYESPSGARYLTYADGGTNDYNFGTTTPFTVEFWVYPTRAGTTTEILYDQSPTSTVVGPLVYWVTTGIPILWYDGADRLTAGSALSNNAWHFITFGRAVSTTVGFWVDGVSIGTSGNNPTCAGGRPRFGAEADNAFPFVGRFDEARITKGVCRYTPGSNFTPPTEPFPSQ